MADRQYITFYLGEDLFGIDIVLVREINRNLDLTPVARAPGFIKGLLNLRGQIVTVVDLRVRLGLPAWERTESSNCIVLKTLAELERNPLHHLMTDETSQDLVGLLVDRIGDVVQVDGAAIDPPPKHASGVSGRFLNGVVKLEDRLLVTLQSSEILKAVQEEETSLTT